MHLQIDERNKKWSFIRVRGREWTDLVLATLWIIRNPVRIVKLGSPPDLSEDLCIIYVAPLQMHACKLASMHFGQVPATSFSREYRCAILWSKLDTLYVQKVAWGTEDPAGLLICS